MTSFHYTLLTLQRWQAESRQDTGQKSCGCEVLPEEALREVPPCDPQGGEAHTLQCQMERKHQQIKPTQKSFRAEEQLGRVSASIMPCMHSHALFLRVADLGFSKEGTSPGAHAMKGGIYYV